MAEPAISIGIKEIFVGIFIVLFGAFSWLVKRSIYGKQVEQDKKMKELEEKFGDFQSIKSCVIMQTGCQRILCQKIDGVSDKMETKIDALVEKIDLVLESHMQMIGRVDAHVNGHGHK